MINSSMKPMYDTKLFTDIFDDAGTFLYYYQHSGIPQIITNDSVNLTYYLLYARYGNNPIANFDEEQFKYKIFSIMFQYGPSWEKRLAMQADIRNLTLQDIQTGTATSWATSGTQSQSDSGSSTDINNHAFNPSTTPTTQSTSELEYIDQQNVSKGTDSRTISGTDSKNTGQTITKSKMDAYAQLWELVATDVTNDYIAKFKKCFKQFVAPERRMIFVTEDDDYYFPEDADNE